jgi:NAD+ kinase
MKELKRILLVGKYNDTSLKNQVQRIANFLVGMNCKVLIDQETKGLLDLNYPVYTEEMAQAGDLVDAVLAVGGDGTMMGACRRWGLYGIPLLGVNQGRVGFLTDLAMDDTLTKLKDILDGKYQTDERFLLEVSVKDNEQIVFQEICLNDVVLGRGSVSKMNEFTLLINGEFVYSQNADGMIISTPTGSTAYSSAAGASIMVPGLEALSICLICPQNMSNRPIVINANYEIKVLFSGKRDIMFALDGIQPPDIVVGASVEIRKTDKYINLIHPCDYSYYNGLRSKLNWTS